MGTRNRRPTLGDLSAVEAYIRAQVLPRFIVRLREIEDRLAEHRLALERAYGDLEEECGEDRRLFESRWTETAYAWRFHEVNDLIREHNEYYAIERALPVDPRTGEYVTISGRSYERDLVGPAWILERFPPRPRTVPGSG
jgi:hypothetical protein